MSHRDYDDFVGLLNEQNQFVIRYDIETMQIALRHESLNARSVAKCVVIVAGTNGKGTIASTLNAMVMSAGLRCGLYTSPHLVSFRERIRVNGEPIARDAVATRGMDLLERYGGAQSDVLPRPLSYFELTTMLAFQHFARSDLDVAILEVGLGGRLDATNALDADIACFASISLDHTAWLGDTLSEIAGEKARVARPGRPALVHPRNGGVTELSEALTQIGARILEVPGDGASPSDRNRAVAKAAFNEICERLNLSEKVRIRSSNNGLDRVRWPGRQTVVHQNGRLIYLDGAHNAESMDAANDWLRAQLAGRLPVVFGVSPERPVADLADAVSAHVSEWLIVETSSGSAQLASDVATRVAEVSTADVRIVTSVEAALNTHLQGRDCIVLGSLYVVGDAYNAIGFDDDRLPRVYDEE